jgi:predicted metal-dependent enzyme (double-stranded beta helix superfamily)
MFDVDRFIADCRAGLASGAPELALKEVVARAVSRPSEVEAVLGTSREGGVAKIHHSPELTILNVVWAPGMAIYPHDHRMWAVIGLYGGREDNTFYRRGDRGLVSAGGRRLESGDTVVLGQSVIHAVANPLRAFTGAIHVYGGDFFGTPRSEWPTEDGEEQPYDVARALKVFADANARWRAEAAGTPGLTAPSAADRLRG